MNGRTLRVIVILVGMLFINIEAAQAGLVTRLKMYIQAEFPRNELVYVVFGSLVAAFILYVIFSPEPGQHGRPKYAGWGTAAIPGSTYREKRRAVTRIAAALKDDPASAQAVRPLKSAA
jgi:hypothetical protein